MNAVDRNLRSAAFVYLKPKATRGLRPSPAGIGQGEALFSSVMRAFGLLIGSMFSVLGAASLTTTGCGDTGAESRPRTTGSGGAIANGGQTVVPQGGQTITGAGGMTFLPPPSSNSGGMTGPETGCNDRNIVKTPVTPTVLLLVDNSSSMFEPREQLWDLLYSTLMDPAMGIVKGLEDKIRFGFASYKGNRVATMETDPKCAEITSVPYALNNFQAIDTTYKKLGTEWMQGVKWETPTGFAINQVAAQLQAFTADPPGPKYILLVTDGNPNTCQTVDPQCGQDLSIQAVQNAYAKGIGTFAIGIGTIVANDPGCDKSWGRCGIEHLQDIANAGVGLPVAPPPENYRYQTCSQPFGNMLQATYAPSATGLTNAPYFTATNAAQLKTALSGLLNGVVSCSFDMDHEVTGDPSLGTVMLSGAPLTYTSEPAATSGWRLDGSHQVTLLGTSCETFKATTGELNI
ncbi:MAG TPA: vWA domain-containing protein, partial [Polyangiaceae bacterium]|nr:vWA domain-containing protein [Polyangiaceae bacterium]